MGLLDIFKDVISPITGLIDALHTSEDEKLRAKAGLLTIQAAITDKVLEYESRLAEAQAKVITAEAQGSSWLQRNWRPLLMLTFTFIVAWNYIVVPVVDAPPAAIPDNMWTLMQLGVGGYILGRSGEKIVPAVISALKDKDK